MRVQLIKESTGFGYDSRVVNWMVLDNENLATLGRLKDGAVCEIPDKIVVGIHNLVNVETGKIVSLHYKLLKITEFEIEQKYKKEKDTSHVRQVMTTVRKLKTNKSKFRSHEQSNDF